jgi:hypothetical protein
VGDAGDFFIFAVNKIAATAGVTGEIVAAVPSYAGALAGLPVGDISADGVDASGNFVSGNTWILNAGPIAFLDECVTVADAAGFDFDADLVAGGFWNISLDDFEITAGLADLDSLHF